MPSLSYSRCLLVAVLIFFVCTCLWYQSRVISIFAPSNVHKGFEIISNSESSIASSSTAIATEQHENALRFPKKIDVVNSVESHVNATSSTRKAEKPNFGGWRCSASPLGTSSWRDAIPPLVKGLGLNVSGDIYEFGVFDGGSMRMFRKFFPDVKLWGFDSFEGLPETKSDYTLGDWNKGAYKTSRLQSDLIRELGGPGKAKFIVGFYDKSLTANLRQSHGMPQAFYIDMDADLYISSIQALDWIFTSRLARVGTLIGYDDWWVLPCARGGEMVEPLQTAVGKAHVEATLKHKIKFRCVAGPCTFTSCSKHFCCWGPIFVVEAYGNDTVPDSGFRMSSKEIQTWKRKNLECLRVNRGWGMDLSKA